MDSREAIRYLIDNVKDKSFTQARVASETNIQRTQINTFLRKAGTLPEKSRIKIAQYLLEKLESINKKDLLELKEAVGALEQFLTQTTSSVTGGSPLESEYPDPYNPLDSRHWAYIERQADEDFNALIQLSSRTILNIVGGAKTGKTSLIRKVRHIFHQDECLIIELDCCEYSEERDAKKGLTILSWIASSVASQLNEKGFFPEDLGYMENGSHFPDWIVNIMAKTKKNSLFFIFDNIEMLGSSREKRDFDDFNEFLGAIFEVVEVSARISALEKCKFIFAIDEGHKIYREPECHVSYLKLRSHSHIFIKNLERSQLAVLVRNYGITDSLFEDVLHQVWCQLAGHPFLTQVFLSKFREIDRQGKLPPDLWKFLQEVMEEPIKILCETFKQRWESGIFDQIGRYLSEQGSEEAYMAKGLAVADLLSMPGIDNTGLFSLVPKNHHLATWQIIAKTKFLGQQLALQWRV